MRSTQLSSAKTPSKYSSSDSGNPAPRLIAATAGRELGEAEDASNNESNSAEAQVASTESPDALDTNEVYLESVATTKSTPKWLQLRVEAAKRLTSSQTRL